jgi:hemerythrin
MLINWDSRFTLNHPIIDREHSAIVKCLNKLHQGIVDQQPSASLLLYFKELIEKTKINFASEEELMKIHQYTNSLDHQVRHNSLLKQVEELYEIVSREDISLDTKITSFLKSWLTHHIMISDRELVKFLKK